MSGTIIQLKRGTYDKIAAGTFQPGEPLFAIDTKEVFISDGTSKYLVGAVYFGVLADRPAPGKKGKLYFATDTQELFLDTGASWVIASGNDSYISTLDDVPDGETYVRSENNFDDEKVSQLNDAYQHITSDGSDHTFINQDVTTTASPTFKMITLNSTPTQSNHAVTKEYVDNTIKSLDWQESIINVVTDPTVLTPNNGDRYIVGMNAIGEFSNQDNKIAVYNDGVWTFITPDEGTVVFNETDGNFNLFNGTVWISFGTAVSHNVLSNLQGTGPDYYHLNQLQYTEATQYADINQNGILKSEDYKKIPSQDEKNALVGTNGIPSATNRYVTDLDVRLTNARTPLPHASTHQHGGSDEIATATPTPNAIPKATIAGDLNGWITVIDGGVL